VLRPTAPFSPNQTPLRQPLPRVVQRGKRERQLEPQAHDRFRGGRQLRSRLRNGDNWLAPIGPDPRAGQRSRSRDSARPWRLAGTAASGRFQQRSVGSKPVCSRRSIASAVRRRRFAHDRGSGPSKQQTASVIHFPLASRSTSQLAAERHTTACRVTLAHGTPGKCTSTSRAAGRSDLDQPSRLGGAHPTAAAVRSCSAAWSDSMSVRARSRRPRSSLWRRAPMRDRCTA
jgi:hypothetical protein